jgi:predicted metal-binding membrane protein
LTIFTHHYVRSVLWLSFFGAILLAWWALYLMAHQMGLNWYGLPVGVMDMADMPPMDSMAMLVPMWAIMMVAMMGPTFVATLSTYEALIISANGSRTGWLGLIVGYFVVWVAFAILIAGVQAGLMRLGWLNMFGMSTTSWVTAALLIVVGWFQFTWLKDVCHGVCHAPMHYFLGNWRPGGMGGLHMGLRLGAYCVVCCWGYMALGFAGGAMNLLWMGLATFLMTLEKLPQVAHYVMRPVGGLLIFAGLAVGSHEVGFY